MRHDQSLGFQHAVQDSLSPVNRGVEHPINVLASHILPPLDEVESNLILPGIPTPPDMSVQISDDLARAGLQAHCSPRVKWRPKLMYSLDILRLDPYKNSINHLSSSITFARDDCTQTDIIGDSVSPPRAPTSAPQVIYLREHSNPPETSSIHPLLTHSSSIRIDNANIDPDHSRNFRQFSTEENNRRRHVCPTCLMRFNRPSSLRTHLNMHTGATREFAF